MKNYAEDFLAEIGVQEKQFAALYRGMASFFSLSDCSMWVLYYLIALPDDVSQQDLIEKMMFPKQTVNSAVATLSRKGLVELFAIPGTRNRKKIILTSEGRKLAEATVCKMRRAEHRAAESMGEEKTAQYLALHREFFKRIQDEFAKEGLPSAGY